MVNPYEAPQNADEQKPEHRKRKLIVVVAVAVGAGLIVGGVSTFHMVQVERARALEAVVIRAKQAAKAEALRAREAALKAKNQREQ